MSASLVVVPTYNERDNIEPICRRILRASDRVDVLIADDGSPDGTGDIADRLAVENERVNVLHRAEKQGLGPAYLAGFAWAREHGYDTAFEFDADGSHQPEEINRFLDELDDGADLVIGTRWMPGGRIKNWPFHRVLISRAGTLFAQIMLKTGLKDITSGYRGIRLSLLDRIGAHHLSSHGYCFQIEMAWRAELSGADVRMVPITFIEREKGASKMSTGIVIEAMWRVLAWGIGYRLASITEVFGR